MVSVLIRYHEIALKKGNRPYFTELLKRNLLTAVKDLGVKEIRSLPARLLLTFKGAIDQPTVVGRIRLVFGVANFSLVERTPRDLAVIQSRILESLPGKSFSSFRIETQRGDKSFPLTSPEINRQLGAPVPGGMARQRGHLPGGGTRAAAGRPAAVFPVPARSRRRCRGRRRAADSARRPPD